ncbi:hypothetical protein WH50_20595 [Pokkaliibacter plantistimulans]|uniref:DUF2292 domain-containing protein n=1 Tax=Pokkaliibacter plantistimulans TaxID=1635171 RepID=A0ABX5LXM2_9GAMM|nr:YezD family protein [Pokkaliibacter plantistimulans]PXF29445.1 hypothetical protein WH50_20595 [Pokkaliibacter plantistimulans]
MSRHPAGASHLHDELQHSAPLDERRQQSLLQLSTALHELIGQIEFGTIELVFHQGKLVQLERREKLRLS